MMDVATVFSVALATEYVVLFLITGILPGEFGAHEKIVFFAGIV